MEEAEWNSVHFYNRVKDCLNNLTPFNDKPLFILDLSQVKAALELYGYPREQWTILTDDAQLLHKRINQNIKETSHAKWEKGMDETDLQPLDEWLEAHGHDPVDETEE